MLCHSNHLSRGDDTRREKYCQFVWPERACEASLIGEALPAAPGSWALEPRSARLSCVWPAGGGCAPPVTFEKDVRMSMHVVALHSGWVGRRAKMQFYFRCWFHGMHMFVALCLDGHISLARCVGCLHQCYLWLDLQSHFGDQNLT